MATAKLIGSDGDTGVNISSQCAFYTRFQATASGRITEFKVKFAASGKCKVAVYADSSDSPTTRLVYNDTWQDVVSGWNTLSIPELDITKDTYYWLAAAVYQSGFYLRGEDSGGTGKYLSGVTSSGWNWPNPATYIGGYPYFIYCAGWGILVVSPSGLSQPISYGTPKLSLSIKPPGYQQAIAYGTPAVTTAGIVISPQGIEVVISYGTPEVQVGAPPLFIYPPGLQVVIAYGTPALKWPQIISPPGLSVPLAYGTPSIVIVGEGVIYVPGHQQAIAYGTPTILKYVWHLILDGQYNIESPETNRTFVIGRDVYGNPVWGEAHDATESALVGERLDFQPDPAIPTTAQAADVAAAVLSKLRLSKKRGVILIPYNCGQELWDVVQITDAGANQSAVSFRVVGLRFEYHPKQARYEHRLILGAP